MRNITLAVEDKVYQTARVVAAKRNTSVSALVRDFLMDLARQVELADGEKERQERQRLVQLFRQCRLELGYKPSRKKTYEGGRFSRF
jgi:superfamily II DNA or RNA helicase